MTTKTIYKIILIIVFFNFAAVLPAQLQFNILEQTLDSVTVDGAIDVKIQLINHSKIKAYHYTCPIDFITGIYLKMKGDSIWRPVNRMVLSEAPWQSKLRPGHQVNEEVLLEHDLLLEPDKTYYLMFFYAPILHNLKEIDYNLFPYYFQNHPGISRRNKYLSDHVVLKTEKLTGADLNAWNQLKKDSISAFYNDRGKNISPIQFDKVEQFLARFPDSRFSNNIKFLYINYLARTNNKVSSLQFENVLEYTKTLNAIEKTIPDWEIDLIKNKKQEN